MDNNTKELVVVAHNLSKNRVQDLLSHYGDSLLKAKEVVLKANTIKVTSEDQVEEMQIARKVRLELKDIRVHVENTRVGLKEQSWREGKAIDGMANIIKAIIVPVEEYLIKQEKFAEEQKKIRDEEEYQKRVDLLTPYVPDITVFDLRQTSMSNETFKKLLENSKIAYNNQKEAEKKAEDERLAAEKAKEKENAKIRQQNEKLRFINEAKQKKLEAARRAQLAAEEKLRKEKAEQERKVLELKMAEEAKLKAESEAKHKEEMAPDKEKLRVIYKDINNLIDKIHFIKFSSEEGKHIASVALEDLMLVKDHMVVNIKTKNI